MTALCLPLAGTAADGDVFRSAGAPLQAYQPNLVGYTRDSGDVGFVDFTLSLKYPLLPQISEHWWGHADRLYLAFTGRFAFYDGTRYSSPVVVKRLNPKLFFQHVFVDGEKDVGPEGGSEWLPRRAQEPRTYATLAYAHESNGQSIETAAAYAQAERTARQPQYVIEQISRGWDYLELNARHVLHESAALRWSANGSVKSFLADGLLQGRPEEAHAWEDPVHAKPRSQVDGLLVRSKFESVRQRSNLFSGTEFSVAYTTGIHSIGRYSTVRLEAGLQALEIPLVVWCSRGYMSDLSRYYVNVRSCGVALAIAGF